MSAWNRVRERHRSRHESLVRSAQNMRPIERMELLCELATSRDPGARRVARALVRRFPELPAADWILEHLDRAEDRSVRLIARFEM